MTTTIMCMFFSLFHSSCTSLVLYLSLWQIGGVTIAIDYTPPPDAALAPNEYRAASGPLILTCLFQSANGTVTYTWDTTLGRISDNISRRTILPAVDSRVHTCTATDTETGVSGTASIPVNIVGKHFQWVCHWFCMLYITIKYSAL